MRLLRGERVEVVIYEPTLHQEMFQNFPVIHDLEAFKAMSDVIVVNRMAEEVRDCLNKVYTRDLFERD